MTIRVAPCGLALLVACSSASPDPAVIEAELPPMRELDDDDRARVDQRAAAALAALERGEIAAARADADRALAIDPRCARALAVRAMTRQRQAHEEQPPILQLVRRADGEMRLAGRLAPADGLVATLHSRFLAEEGHLTAAADRAERGLAEAGAELQLLELAAACRYELGDERAAVAHLQALLEQRPDDRAALFRLGECQLAIAGTEPEDQRGVVYRAAVDAFARYRAIVPDDVDGYLGEAQARFELLDSAGAETDVSRVLSLLVQAAAAAPASPRPDFNRGVVLDRLGRDAEARQAYAAALLRDPSYAAALLNLAANQAQAGLDDEARASCQRALGLELERDDRRRVEEFLASDR